MTFFDTCKDKCTAAPLRRLLAGAALTFGCAPLALAQEMPLGVGDEIQVVITGLPDLGLSAKVLENGAINLAWLGDFDAQGRAVDDLETSIRREIAGFIIKQYDREGGQFLVQLEAADINIMRTAQKAVVVAGTVTTPGEVIYTPDMTVRDAVALAGGIDDRLLPENVDIDALQVARWQSEFGQAAMEYAQASILSWRIDAEIAENPSPELSRERTTAVASETWSQIEEAQRRILQENLASVEANETYFTQAVVQAEQRLDILRQQQETMTEALAAEEAEEARIVDLVERGLAPGSRETDARRATILTATRLLDIEDDLASTEIALTRTLRNAEEFAEMRIARLLADQVAAEERAREARLRMDVLGQFLALAGSEVATIDVTSEFGVTTVVYRRTDGELRQIAADMDTLLMPGDTLEAKFEEIVPEALTD